MNNLENPLQTVLGQEIPLNCKSIFMICNLTPSGISIEKEMLFRTQMEGIECYANIPNPESQLVTGNSYDELISNLLEFKRRFNTPTFIEELKESI